MGTKPNPLLVILTALWRLGIAISAFAGWWLYGHDPEELPFLTQSGNLLVSIVYLGLVVYYPLAGLISGREPGSGKVRGAMTLLMMVVGCTYVGVMGGDIDNPADLLAHVVTPLLVFVDWCIVGRSQNRTRWWHPFLWLIIPGVWLIGYSLTGGYRFVRGGSPLYGFADPRDGDYPVIVVGLVVATVAGGFLLFGIGKIKSVLSRAVFGAPASTGRPQPMPGQPYPPQPPFRPQPPMTQQPPYPQPTYQQQTYQQQTYQQQGAYPSPAYQQQAPYPQGPPPPQPPQPQPPRSYPQQQPPSYPPRQQPSYPPQPPAQQQPPYPAQPPYPQQPPQAPRW